MARKVVVAQPPTARNTAEVVAKRSRGDSIAGMKSGGGQFVSGVYKIIIRFELGCRGEECVRGYLFIMGIRKY